MPIVVPLVSVPSGAKSTVTMPDPVSGPPAPQHLTAATSAGTVALDWDDVSWPAGSTGRSYEVHEDLFGGVDNLVATVTVSNRTSAALPAGTYRYYIVAKDSTGKSAPSAKVTITVGANPPPPPPPGSLLINGDVSTGDFSQYRLVQNKFYDSYGNKYPPNYPATIITDPTIPAWVGHKKAIRIEVRNGDWPGFAHGERSEVRPSDVGGTTGDTQWVQMALKFDATYPAAHDGYWCIVWQFHGHDATPPPFSFSTYNNSGGTKSPANRLALQLNTGGSGLGVWSTPINRGVWHKIKMQIHFQQDNTGWVRLWHDDVAQTFDNGSTQRFMTTMNPGSGQASYSQFGTYRGDQTVSGGTDIVYFTGFKMGTTEGSVS